MTMNRTQEPQFLKDNKNKWTCDYVKTGKWNTNWHGHSSEILKELKNITDSHCAFCDDSLMPKGGIKGQIEHLKPKDEYKLLAYAWLNLFPCCEMCNTTKGKKFDSSLLRPDSNGFSFRYWFYIDFGTFEIKPKKLGNPEWKRAEKTIEIYGLNKPEKIERRIFAYHNPIESKNINNQAFRFMFA